MRKLIFVLIPALFLIFACEKENPVPEEQYVYEEDYDLEEENDQENEEDNGEEGDLTLYRVEGDEIIKIRDFEVVDNLKPFQQDIQKHREMWSFVTRLIPLKDLNKVSEFVVFHGSGTLAGYVFPPDYEDLSQWRFGLAIDLADELEVIKLRDEFSYTAIHEFGHVLSLNDDQVIASGENCSNYLLAEGCAMENAYINLLFDLGWKDIKEGDPYEIYEKYPSRFVTEYAASNPGEDIAEVFTNFVIQEDNPRGNTIADQKIKMCYGFPELVALRNEIRSNTDMPTLARMAKMDINSPFSKRKCRHIH